MFCAQEVLKKIWLSICRYLKKSICLFKFGGNGRLLLRFYMFDILDSLFLSFCKFITISILYILISVALLSILYHDKIQSINIYNLVIELKDEYKINLAIAVLTLLSVHFGFWRNRQQMKEQQVIQYKLNSAQEINELLTKTSDNLLMLRGNIYIIDNFMLQLSKVKKVNVFDYIGKHGKMFEEYYKMVVELCNHEILFKKKQAKFMGLMAEVGLNYYLFELLVRYCEIVSKLKDISLPFDVNQEEMFLFLSEKIDKTQYKRLLQNVDALYGSIQITYDVIASKLQKDIIKGKFSNLLTICRSENLSRVIIEFSNYMKSRKNYHIKLFYETKQELYWENFINYKTGILEKNETENAKR